MIFHRIKIENFGKLHDFELDLTPGFNHFCRPNEAGKSSLLEFVCRLFWGYPDRRRKLNMYPTLHSTGRYGGEITLATDDGNIYRLERYGEKGVLRCFAADGSEVDAAQWCRDHLAGCSENFFRNVFAITIDELVSLDNVENGEMRHLLYGAELGIDPGRLARFSNELKTRTAKLYRTRGSCRLAALAGEYSDKLQHHGATVAAAADAAVCREKLNTASLRLEEKEKELQQLRQQSEILKQRRDAAILQREIGTLQETLTSLPLPPEEKLLAELDTFLDVPPPAAPDAAALLQEENDLTRYLDPVAARPLPPETIRLFSETEKRAIAEVTAYVAGCRRRSILLFSALLLAISGVVPAFLTGVWFFAWAGLAALVPLLLLRRFKTVLPESAARAEKLREEVEKSLAVKADFNCDKLSELNYRTAAWQKLRSDAAAFQNHHRELARLVSAIPGCPATPEECRNFLKSCRSTASRRQLIEAAVREKSAALSAAGTNSDAAPEELAALLEQNQEKCRCAETRQLELAREHGALKTELHHLMRQGDPAASGTELAALETRINETAAEVLTLQITSELLERAVASFESQHQPAVLRSASTIFAALTGGRYTAIRRKLTDGQLLFHDSLTHTDKSLDQLSRGSREQLLLALRFALIAHRENEAEKIPLFLDDVLVNFDHERQKNAITVLREFAAPRQVILLTCREIPAAAE